MPEKDTASLMNVQRDDMHTYSMCTLNHLSPFESRSVHNPIKLECYLHSHVLVRIN